MKSHQVLPVLTALPLAFALALSSPSASATASDTFTQPPVQLEDAWDRRTRLDQFPRMPLLLVYEDKGSATLNAPLKRELSELAKGDRYRDRVALVAVADVSGYDYWPVRGFVKDAIKSESRKQGTTIYCDWDGHVREQLRLVRGTSNVQFFGRNGALLFARAGALTPAERAALIALLKKEIEPS